MTPPKPSPQGGKKTIEDRLRYKIAEAYQIVGSLAQAAGLSDDLSVGDALDHFSDPDNHLNIDLLPWSPESAPLVEALSENERLKWEVERVSDLAHRLAKLFHAAAQASWDGCDLDGGTIQNLGEELRLLKREPYDPDEHGESIDADPGDEIYTLADEVSAALNPPGGQG